MEQNQLASDCVMALFCKQLGSLAQILFCFCGRVMTNDVIILGQLHLTSSWMVLYQITNWITDRVTLM